MDTTKATEAAPGKCELCGKCKPLAAFGGWVCARAWGEYRQTGACVDERRLRQG